MIVIDNDAAGSAKPAVREFATDEKLIYDLEHRQNISHARNKSLSHASADYIAIIDDDEYAEPHWLLNLYNTITSYEADVVHGPVVPLFSTQTPAYVSKSVLFTRPHLPTGSTQAYTRYTGNVLFRRKLIEKMETPFDPRFGRTGGEDVVFFNRLKQQGCKMVWCNEAETFEIIPSERANVPWLVKRFFRNGNITYHIEAGGGGDTVSGRACCIVRSCKMAMKHFLTLPLYSFGSLFSLHYSSKMVRSLERIAFQAGFLSAAFNVQYEEYR